MLRQCFSVILVILYIVQGRHAELRFAKLTETSNNTEEEELPGNLRVKINPATRRAAFEGIWGSVVGYLQGGDQMKNHGVGLFPDSNTAFSEDMKEIRFKEYFTPAYDEIVFLPRYPAVTGVNFFTLLSDEEKELYLGSNITEHHMRHILEKNAPNDLNEYDEMLLKIEEEGEHYEDQEEEEEEEEDDFFHSFLESGMYFGSNEFVNFTQPDFPALNTGAYPTAGIFSAITILEYLYRLKNIFHPILTMGWGRFSRQFILDCGDPDKAWYPHTIFHHLHKRGFGLPTEHEYGYKGERSPEECPATQFSYSETHHEMIKVAESKVHFAKEKGMISLFKEYGPVSVCITVNEHVFYYVGGKLNLCTGGVSCNHYVTLLGYNDNYLSLQNSWGVDWGVNGMVQVLRGNCVSAPANNRFLVTAVSMTIDEDIALPRLFAMDGEEGEEEEEGEWLEVPEGYDMIMSRGTLSNGKDYWFDEEVQIGDILLFRTNSLEGEEKDAAHITFFQSKPDSQHNVPYFIAINLKHHYVYQTYFIEDGGGEALHFPRLIEKLTWENWHTNEGEIRIQFTRELIATSVNGQHLEPFYYQTDMKSLHSFEVVGPEGFFKSVQHLREKEEK